MSAAEVKKNESARPPRSPAGQVKITYYSMVHDAEKGVFRGQRTVVQVGRDKDNDIVLDSPFVPPHAIVFERTPEGWQVVCLGSCDVLVAEEKLLGGQKRVLAAGEEVRLFPFMLTLELDKQSSGRKTTRRDKLDEENSTLLRAIHRDLLDQDRALLDRIGQLLPQEERQAELDPLLENLERDIETIALRHGLGDAKQSERLDHISAYSVRSAVLAELSAQVAPASKLEGVLVTNARWSHAFSVIPDREAELFKLQDFFSTEMGLIGDAPIAEKIGRVESSFWDHWAEHNRNVHRDFKQYLALRYLKKEIKDIIFGFGPLEDLLRLPAVSEIMVVDSTRIYVERSGLLEMTGRRFITDAVTEAIIQRIVARVGRRIDKSQPLVDARLPDGSRVNAVIPPLAVSGPCLTIRKFSERRLTVDTLVGKGALTNTVSRFLKAAVHHRKNILISGGTGTGKTTLLNCLSDFIPDEERIVTVEDTAELRLNKEHVVRLETKDANIEGTGAYTIRDLVKNALRMRPDRIVVGECRGAEALDMLQAMNTGHDGSLTTIHANTARDVILRLEVLVQMAADLPLDSIHRQIASAIDMVVQLRRLHNGRRCVVQVTEVVGMNRNGNGLDLRDLFLMDEDDEQGQLHATGRLPTFMDELIERNLFDLESFYL